MIGKTISHYKILEKLGEGGMGVVYKAEDTKLDRTVALKFLPLHLVSDEEAKTRFTHEAKAASALDHPNIATIYEIDEAEGQSFISMAFVDGKPLKDVVRDKELSIEQILDIAIQTSEGLRAAHKRGIVHRDIKSDNIMLTGDGVARIMDFGLAKLEGARKVTKPGSTVGTVAYMSPEQCQGMEVDERSDIFSFGVVLYEMITGQLPFKGEHEAAVMYSIVNQEPVPLVRLRSDVPPALERIVQRALEKDRGKRFQRVDEILRELKNLKEGFVSSRISLHRPSRHLRKLLVPAMVIAAVAVALVVGIRIQVGRQPAAVAGENSLAVMYFENLADPGDPQRLGEIVTNLIITDLSESQYMRVVSSQRLYDILKLLGKEGAKVIDREVASQVAREANARWMLLGNILKVDPQIVITAQLVDVSTGEVVASQRISGEPEEEIFSIIDKLTVEIREDLSLPAAALREPDVPVGDVTTHSADAYRYFLEGAEEVMRHYSEDAERNFRRAIEFDSTFAMAYYMLSFWGPMEERGQNVAKAMEHLDSVTERERHLILARDAYFSGEHERAIRELEQILERDPDDKLALLWVGINYRLAPGKAEESIKSFEKLIEIDPPLPEAYNQLAYAYHDVGDFDNSIWAINKYISMAPDEANPYDSRGDLYAYSGRIDEAIESYKKAMEIKPGFSLVKLGHMYLFKKEYVEAEKEYRKMSTGGDRSVRSSGRVALSIVPLYQGKFEEALKVLDDGIAADRVEQIEGMRTAYKHRLKAVAYEEQGKMDAFLREGERVAAIVDTLYGSEPVRLSRFYVYVLAKCGRIAEAESAVQGLRQRISERAPGAMPAYWIALADLEKAKGERELALSHLERAEAEAAEPGFYLRFVLAEAYLEAGKLGEAVSQLERALSRYDEDRASVPVRAVKAYYLLGLAYERSGWKDEAIEQYEEFLDVWKDADPGIEEIEDAKARLTRLKSAA